MTARHTRAIVTLPRCHTRNSKLEQAMATMPAASPSRPSMRFVMFTNTTRYATVSGKSSHPKLT